MTIMEAINRIDAIKPNSYPQGEKIRWLNSLDSIVKRQIIDTHEGGGTVAFDGYTEDTLLTATLLVPFPYDEMYILWLESKIDYYNGETGRYNNSISMFNTSYEEFDRYWNRTHMPIGKKFKYFGTADTNNSRPANGLLNITIEEA